VDQQEGGRVDDAATLRAARNGDREAFMQLVRVHQAGVRAFASGLLGDRTLAEDVAQEAFLRAWRGLPRFRGEAAFATWLYTIVRRVAADQVRRPVLRTVLGLSYQEVGAMTGAPVGTVASRVFRARTRLAAALGAREEDPA
jgi:DNA-directed RNA polymerase specialized sigma24 family protein